MRYNPEPSENAGRDVEPEVLAGIFTELAKRFGAYTPLGLAGSEEVPGGLWKGQVEPSVRIEVSVPQDRILEVRQFVYEVGERLGQKEMYFKAGPPCVELIKIEPSAGNVADGRD